METYCSNEERGPQDQEEPRPVVTVAATEATDRDMQAAELVCKTRPIYNTTFRTSESCRCSDREQQAGLLCIQYDRGQFFASPHCCQQPCLTHMHRRACACGGACCWGCRMPSARRLHLHLQWSADMQVHVHVSGV